ncbi:MAG: PorT family protein [Flammeovirgaceae bacterium]|jgi:hypothetical protein|nr:PorT family protein [Flammeovirgaceae bacterium]
MKLILPLVVFVCLCFNSAAQDFRLTAGQYETKAGNKVLGLFISKGIDKNSNSYIFKENEKGSDKNLTPDDVKSITLNNGEYLISIHDSLKQTNFFATRILSGSLNLYEFYDGDQAAYYLEKGTTSSIIRGKNSKTGKASNTYKGTLNYFIKGCDQAENKIERMTFRASDIMQVVASYNKCVDINYKVTKNKKNVLLELNVGTTINRHYFKAQSFYLNEKQDFKAGLAFGIKYSLFINPKVSAYTGLNYRNYKSSIKNFQSPFSAVLYNADFTVTSVNLPLGVNYYLINDGVYKLAIGADYQFGRLLDEGFTETSSINSTPVDKKTKLENISSVFSTGVNFSYRNYVANLNYYRGSYIVGNQQSLTTSGLEFLIGYRIIDTRK